MLTAINLTNKLALYNFLSTFSGTHYVTPARVDGANWVSLLRNVQSQVRWMAGSASVCPWLAKARVIPVSRCRAVS